MHRKRTIALLSLLLLIVIACILQRTTVFAPSITEEVITETPAVPEEEITPAPVVPSEELTTPSEPVTPNPKPPVVTPAPVTAKNCYVGGCSSHICSDNPDVMSTCEWRESYACYQTATCELQASGECGWTETPALKACVLQANATTLE